VGADLLANGGFESAFPGPFVVSPNMANSTISTIVKHSGNARFAHVATAGGTTRGSAIYQDLTTPLTQNASYTLSYWYLPNTKGGTLTLRLSGSGIKSTIDIAPAPGGVARSTPGVVNNVTASLPEFPPVWINEVLPNNTAGILDRRDEHDPWIELINTGSAPADLSGWYLTDTYTILTRWSFPSGTSIPRRLPADFWRMLNLLIRRRPNCTPIFGCLSPMVPLPLFVPKWLAPASLTI